MKCRTDGGNFVNKIRMKCVFLLHKSHADTKTGRKKPSVHNGIPIGRLFFCRGKCRINFPIQNKNRLTSGTSRNQAVFLWSE